MKVKPTYEELERRVQELEKIESEFEYSREALRESENLFKRLYDKTPLGYQSLDENGHFIVVNQTWLDTLGYAKEEVIGKSFADFLHPDWRDHFKENFPRFKSIGEVLGVEFEMVKKNGNLILVSFTGKIGRDKKGGFQQTHCVFHDITERKRTEELLQEKSERIAAQNNELNQANLELIAAKEKIEERENRFRLAMQASHDGLFDWNLETNEIYYSPGWKKMLGYQDDELPNDFSVWEKATDPEDVKKSWELQKKLITKQIDRFVMEFKMRHKDGHWVDILSRAEAIFNDSGKAIRIVGTHTDITERKQAEIAMKESEQFLQILLESIPLPVFYKDVEGRYKGFNKAFETFFGRPRSELIGCSVFDINPPELARIYHAKDSELLKKISTQVYESQVKNAYGELRDVVFHKSSLTNSSGTITGLVGAIMDVTEPKRAKDELRESEEKFFTVFATNPIPSAISTLQDGRFINVNEAFLEVFAYSSKTEIIGKTSVELGLFANPHDRQSLRKAMEEKEIYHNRDLKMVTKDGRILDMLFSAEPLSVNNKQCLITNVVDITVLKQTEEALIEKEALFRGLFEHMTSGSAVYEVRNDGSKGTDYIIRGFNRKSLELEGKNLDEVVGKSLFDLRPNIDDYGLIPVMKKVWETGIPGYFPAKIYQDDNFSSYYENHIFKLPSGQVVTIYNDVTDQKNQEKELQESEKKYRVLFDTFPLGITISDQFGNIVESNAVSEKILGIPKTEHEARTIYEPTWRIIRPDGTPMPAAEYASVQALQEKRLVENVEMGVVKPDTGITWINVTASPLNLEKFGVVVTYGDVTARKKIEEENRRFRTIADNSVYGKTIADLQGNLLYVNRFFADIHGYSTEELAGRHISVFHSQEQMETVDRIIASMMREEHFPPTTVWHRHQDGTEFPMLMSGVLIKDDYGNPQCIATSAIDMTTQQKTEQEYKTLFREMLNGFALHEIVCDAEGKPVDYRFLAVNPAFERLTGLKAEVIVGRTVLEVFPDIEKHWIETYGKVALSGEPIFFENHTAELGKHFEVTAFRSDLNQFACIFQDITERKLAEAEREKLQAQLTQAQKMESVGRLAGGVAHDFNNMLSVIIGNAELALENMAPNDPLRDHISEIFSAARRSADVTRQLLAFARKQTIAPKVLDLNQTIETMLKMLRRLIGEDIDLMWLPGKNVWPVRMDPSQIDQILANLCVNARDAIADVGKITIETGTATFDSAYCLENPGFVAGDFILLAVSDDGSGMDKETISHLFEPFFTTKELGKGTGLGLATIFGIVKQNNGFINVYSEPGQGSTFKIYLPRNPTKTESLEKKTSDNLNLAGAETILLVEDEPSILKMTRMMLEQMGYKVLAAGTPGEAIALAQEHIGGIHLLITDVVMPEMNGRDLAGNLLSLYPNLKRLFMSGYTADVIAHHGVLDKGVQFIQKPFIRQTLAIKVREALGEAK
jgi:PAS domain S-box-containing protein